MSWIYISLACAVLSALLTYRAGFSRPLILAIGLIGLSGPMLPVMLTLLLLLDWRQRPRGIRPRH